ncbi:putative ribonuclease H-like domain-containing protein [Tanacetum coccineum]|uniref:Ribonuclease H-like domain-containing protein n=1 Tax=Tanacetum coccineum TaxID=301880 RepID=A0ABQ5GQW5_9ASTR
MSSCRLFSENQEIKKEKFIVHGPSIHAAQNKHSEERTADKEVPLSSEEQALHDELVSLMHQESIAKLHNDAQRNAFEEEKRRIALEKGKESANSTLTLSTANTPSQSTGNTPTDSDDDVPKDGVFSTNSFDDENTDNEEDERLITTTWITPLITAGVLTRRKLKESASDQHQALLSFIYKQNRTNHKDQQTCLFACFLSQGTQESLSSLANEIGLSDASRTASTQATKYGCQKCILYGNITEEVYVKPPPGFEDPAHPNKGLQSIKALWLYIKPPEHGLRLGVPHVLNCFKTRHNVCCLSVCKVSSHSKEAFSDSDYAGDNHDRRSTLGGCQYLGKRLVSWQCKKQTIVAISS